MFGRSASLLLALLLLASTQAHAKKQNLVTGIPFGIGFAGGLEPAPGTDFTSGARTTSKNYSNYFLFMPYYDLVNITFQPYFGWHFYPDQGGTAPGFTETSEMSSTSYGLRVMLSPFLSKAAESRGYIVASAGFASAKVKTSRRLSAAITNNEELHGTGIEMAAGAGIEFILIQNYSMQIEAGYTQRNIDTFKYSGTTDAAGGTHNDGDEALISPGHKKAFHLWGPYLQLALNLNF